MIRDKVTEYLDQGFAVEIIMKKLNVSWSTVGGIARQLGYQQRTVYKTWKQIEDERSSINGN